MRQRTKQAFKQAFDYTVTKTRDLQIGMPVLSRYRRPPARMHDGGQPYQISALQEYYQQMYYQAYDLLKQEVPDRFDEKKFLPEYLGLESLC